MVENQFQNITTMADKNFVLTMDNPKFATYMVVASLLILKMFGLVLLTIHHRFKNKVFISEEDAKLGGAAATTGVNEDVERVRRALQNDLENIPVFLFISLLYLWVSVPSWVVHLLYYLFLLVRVGHSFVYAVYVIPQPSRALCFLIGFLITSYLTFHVLIYALVVGYGGK